MLRGSHGVVSCRSYTRARESGREREREKEDRKHARARALDWEGERNRGLRTMWNGDDGKGWGKAMRRWGWGQWRCPSEGHGRECGLRPSVQSGVPRCGALSLSLPPSSFSSQYLSLFLSSLSLSLSSLLTRSLTRSLRFPAFSDTAPPPVPLPAFVHPSLSLFLFRSLSLVPRRGAARGGSADCKNAPNAPY